MGTRMTLVSITRRVKGTPMRTKSLKRYWPGPSTRVLTGDEMGVIKAADAARATIIAKGAGETCNALALAMATGAISTAVAVLEINKPMSAVVKNKIAKITRGPVSPNKLSKASTAKSIPPVFCRARAKGNMPTIKIMLCQ